MNPNSLSIPDLINMTIRRTPVDFMERFTPITRIYFSLVFGILLHFYEYLSEQNNLYFSLVFGILLHFYEYLSEQNNFYFHFSTLLTVCFGVSLWPHLFKHWYFQLLGLRYRGRLQWRHNNEEFSYANKVTCVLMLFAAGHIFLNATFSKFWARTKCQGPE